MSDLLSIFLFRIILNKINMEIQWKGVYPAVTTMFTDNNEIDYIAIEKNYTAMVDAGVNGLILGGTLGEASTLSTREKADLLGFTLKHFGDRVPVLMNVAEQTTQSACESAIRAEEIGADGLMLLPPMRYNSDSRETVTFIKKVAGSTSLPIILYNNPVDYKIEITIDMFRELEECINIQAVKESTRDVSNVTRMINAFGDRFKVLTGVDTLGMESLVMGADGWVAGLVCAFPAETVAIYRLVKSGRLQEALSIYRWFLPLLELDVSTKLVQNIKLAGVATGINTENVRAPRLKLGGNEREKVQAIIDKAMENRPVLPDYMNI
jgi:1-pyrroline-4-hydroxy-2-carboxylate deaminase